MSSLNNINKYTLLELQNIAVKFGLTTKKSGNKGFVNKLKKELYDEISKELL